MRFYDVLVLIIVIGAFALLAVRLYTGADCTETRITETVQQPAASGDDNAVTYLSTETLTRKCE